MKKELLFRGKKILLEYSTRRKSSIGISVLADDVLVLKLPLGIDESLIFKSLESNWAKILAIKVTTHQVGSLHQFLGEHYPLKCVDAKVWNAEFDGHSICLYGPQDLEYTNLLDRFYLEEARKLLPQRVTELLALTPWVNFFPRLHIRIMTSRWGSCSNTGRISLNAHLIKAKPCCIDSVIAHELCHIAVQAHNQAFYDLWTKVAPNWRNCRADLKKI